MSENQKSQEKIDTTCQNCLYYYNLECKHSHGPLVPTNGVCGGKIPIAINKK